MTEQTCFDSISNWLLGDHLGSTSMTANADGTFHSEVRYSAFGETRYSSGTMTTDYLYTGQRQEAEVGLYYYVARWYDPAIGRFIQADSIVPDPGTPLGYDRFAYVANNPLKYIDPSGHVFEDPHDPTPFLDGICGSSQQSSSSSNTSDNSSSALSIPGLPQIDGGLNLPAPSSTTPSLSVRDAFGNRPELQIYTPWEVDILFELFWNGGQEGLNSANYIIAYKIRIEVGKTTAWQSLTHVAAWYKGNSVFLSPSAGYSDTQTPNIWGISLVAHEAKHIEQGSFPQALTKGNEMEAWQLGITIYRNLGGSTNQRDDEVLKATSVKDFAYAIKHYDNTGYWSGLKLLPPYFKVP